jgi:hypothetical protein
MAVGMPELSRRVVVAWAGRSFSEWGFREALEILCGGHAKLELLKGFEAS